MSRRPRATSRVTSRGTVRSRATVKETRAPRHAATSTTRDASLVAVIEPRRRRSMLLVKVVVIVALVGATLFVGGQWLLRQSYFRVQHVALSGEVHETSAQILLTTHLDTHPTMIDLSSAALQHDLSIYPWIGSVVLVKKWPNTVDLTVHEVSAVAVAFNARNVLQYVSVTGRDLGVAPLNTNMTTLSTTPTTLAATTWPYGGVESAAARVASQLPVAFASQVSQVISDAQGNVTLQLTTPIKFFLGAATNLNAKFVAVASAIAHGTFAAGDVVDVTTPSELSVTGPSPS